MSTQSNFRAPGYLLARRSASVARTSTYIGNRRTNKRPTRMGMTHSIEGLKRLITIGRRVPIRQLLGVFFLILWSSSHPISARRAFDAEHSVDPDTKDRGQRAAPAHRSRPV